MALEEVAPTLRATILAHCRLGGFEPNVRFEVQLQQTVLSLVDEGAGICAGTDVDAQGAARGRRVPAAGRCPADRAGAGMVTGKSESVSGAFS